MKRLNNVHPGEVLREEFMIGITISDLSCLTNIPEMELFQLIIGTRNINLDIALKLARYFRTTPNYWINLQKSFDDELNDLVQSI